MARNPKAVWTLLLILAIILGYWALQPGEPRRVVDEAALLTPSQEARLSEYHRFLLQDHDIDYRVVLTRNSGDIGRFSLEAFERTHTGAESRTGHGLLLVVDAGQDQVRIEVSQSLEGILPDTFVAYVEQRQMTPFFAAGRVADGILATSELIISRVGQADVPMEEPAEPLPVKAAGAGATAPASLRQPVIASPPPLLGEPVPAGSAPERTLGEYFAALAARNSSPDLDLFTSASREMMAGQVITAGQMDNVIKTYRTCTPEPARISEDGRHAVIRYPLAQRQCSPWFLARSEDGGWRLDLATQRHAIRYGRNNAWRFWTKRTPYQFAFSDWGFDQNGYPLPIRWGISANGMRDRTGVVIVRLVEGAPAASLGFRVGDWLQSWNGEDIRDHRHFAWLMNQAKSGEPVSIHLVRGGEEMMLEMKAPPRPSVGR